MVEIAVRGPRFAVVWAENQNGRMPAREFFERKLSRQEKAKVLSLFKRFATMGTILNREQFKPLGDGLFEFKSFQVRLIGGYGPNQNEFSIAVGLKKKKGQHSPKDLKRARRVLEEHEARCRRGAGTEGVDHVGAD